MYSPKQILKQEPAGIVTVLALINAALIAFGVYSMTDVQLAAANAAALGLLTLFYIRPATVTRDALQELSDGQQGPIYKVTMGGGSGGAGSGTSVGGGSGGAG